MDGASGRGFGSGSNSGRLEVGRRSVGAAAACDGCGERNRTRQEALATGPGASWRGSCVSGERAPSGRERQRAESCQGATELVLPGPALGQMQGEANERVSRPAREKKRRLRAWWYQLLTQTDARGPAGQVVGDDLDGQPVAARGEMVSPTPTSGLGWHSRSRRGGDGRPPVPGSLNR